MAETPPVNVRRKGGSGGGLVKCCNFVVNLGCSLGVDLMVEVMFNLEFFSLEGNPSLYMRELYCVYVDLYPERRGNYIISVVCCISSFCWII